MARLGLETAVIDAEIYEHALRRLREARVRLPTFAQLRDPALIPADVASRLAAIDPDTPDPLNLFRVHWFNAADRRGRTAVPEHVEIPSELSGVPARIVLALGNRFPMIAAHKVLAAYGCLAPRLVTGQFDPTWQRAVWPSTGNYCRGGVAIARIMGCRGIAVLPENMSRERFEWLDRWVMEAADIVRTSGSESNVHAIYDASRELERDPANVVFNQFCEFGNYLVHRSVTGAAMQRLFAHLATGNGRTRLAAWVAASGSSGTLAAGDHLKQALGARIVVAEAVECPTLLENGFGQHNIQGIGDKHVPFIHNVMNSDLVAGVSEVATDTLNLLFNTETGRAYLVDRRCVAPALVRRLGDLGLSSICNLLAAIKTAKYFDLGPDDVVLTVATDGAAMYASERDKAVQKYFGNRFDAVAAAETWGCAIAGAATDRLLEMTRIERRRAFNLGYFTWVEQQGVSLEAFERRRLPSFWDGLLDLLEAWDAMITEFNSRSAVAP